jgi:hypothetical protein
MTVPYTDILNAFTLFDPSIAASSSVLVTIVSIFLCSIISVYFFKTYRFSGFRYLLGLPAGFTLLSISFVFEHLSLYSYFYYSSTNSFLYTTFFWIQLTLQSEGLALISLSFIGSLLARLAGLTLFVYAIRYALAKARISGDVEIETREET